MTTLPSPRVSANGRFDDVLASFLHQPGLPFADVLDAPTIEQTFADHDALFATDAIYATPLVVWAFLAQVLHDGKGAACAAAVADIATYRHQRGQTPPRGNTGDYCRARAKLDPAALRDLVRHTATRLDDAARSEWLWCGHHAKLVDGFTFTLPDTPANQAAFPQNPAQAPGVGLPIARACAVLSLATGALHDVAIGPYQGKGTGEAALLRTIIDRFEPGDVAVFDRCFCSYMMIALFKARGVEVCARLHQRRDDDVRDGQRLGDGDRLVTWTRPACPAWMPAELYEQIPATLTVRLIDLRVTTPGARVEQITVATTLLDPVAYPQQAVADLYGYRWNVELDIRQIKQTLGLDHLRCKSPAMIERELWVTLLAYNLIRTLIATAAAVHGKQPRQLGFTLACQTVLASWMMLATGTCRDASALIASALARIAANEVADRPGRVEPRVIKRRRHRYPLMQKPRDKLRAELLQS